MLKVNNGNTRTRCEICSKLTSVSIVNFEYVITDWVVSAKSRIESSACTSDGPIF